MIAERHQVCLLGLRNLDPGPDATKMARLQGFAQAVEWILSDGFNKQLEELYNNEVDKI